MRFFQFLIIFCLQLGEPLFAVTLLFCVIWLILDFECLLSSIMALVHKIIHSYGSTWKIMLNKLQKYFMEFVWTIVIAHQFMLRSTFWTLPGKFGLICTSLQSYSQVYFIFIFSTRYVRLYLFCNWKVLLLRSCDELFLWNRILDFDSFELVGQSRAHEFLVLF